MGEVVGRGLELQHTYPACISYRLEGYATLSRARLALSHLRSRAFKEQCNAIVRL
jgi:hypothetical protein